MLARPARRVRMAKLDMVRLMVVEYWERVQDVKGFVAVRMKNLVLRYTYGSCATLTNGSPGKFRDF